MLYVFHGTNTHSAVTKASSLVSSLRTKKPDASYVRIEAQQWHPTIIEQHSGGQGLFSNKYIIFLDRITENSGAKDALADLASMMAESTNIFIVLEHKLNTELKKSFDTHAEKIVECENDVSSKNTSRDDFNIFILADAVGARDAIKAWSVYRQAIDQGIESESIIGTLFWQIKSMKLAMKTKNASESGLSPFVFSKAKKATEKYSEQEIDILMKNLITVYHDAHRGLVDAELGVERMMLILGK